jgi:hypothetical protein
VIGIDYWCLDLPTVEELEEERKEMGKRLHGCGGWEECFYSQAGKYKGNGSIVVNIPWQLSRCRNRVITCIGLVLIDQSLPFVKEIGNQLTGA